MTERINLTQLRARAELYEDNLALKDTLLALIDTVEAAQRLLDGRPDGATVPEWSIGRWRSLVAALARFEH